MRARKLEPEELKLLMKTVTERFGLRDDIFSGYDFYMDENDRFYMLNREASVLVGSYDERIAKIGLLFGRNSGEGFIPANNLLQLFGSSARRNVVELTKPKTHIYIEGFDVNFEDPPVESGCVVLRYDGKTLGRGHMRNFVLENRIPKNSHKRLTYL